MATALSYQKGICLPRELGSELIIVCNQQTRDTVEARGSNPLGWLKALIPWRGGPNATDSGQEWRHYTLKIIGSMSRAMESSTSGLDTGLVRGGIAGRVELKELGKTRLQYS